MGLDFTIELHIKDKATGNELVAVDIAYWRKAYGIRDELIHLCRSGAWWKFPDEEGNQDYITTTTITGLRKCIECLVKEIPNPESDMWSSNVWANFEVINMTLVELRALCATHYWLTHPDDYDAFYQFVNNTDTDIDEMLAELGCVNYNEFAEKWRTFDYQIVLRNSY